MTDSNDSKPLEPPPYTMFHNFILDHIMPRLSPNAWKVLCCAIRKTIGWADADSPTGRKISDVISYSQFMESTGIGGRSTLSAALTECMNEGYLLRQQAGSSRGRPIYSYRLNTDYRVPKQDSATTTDRVLDQDSTTTARVPKQDSIESQNRTSQSPETGHTKETKKEKQKDDVVVSFEMLLGLGIDEGVARHYSAIRSRAQIEAWDRYVSGAHGRTLADPAAFVVSRLKEDLWPPTTKGKNGHGSQRDRRSYIEGEYADFILH